MSRNSKRHLTCQEKRSVLNQADQEMDCWSNQLCLRAQLARAVHRVQWAREALINAQEALAELERARWQ